MTIVAINPATGEQLASFQELSTDQLDAALARAHETLAGWRARPLAERAELVRAIGGVLRRRQPELARLASLEMGKPITEALAEVEKSAAFCDYYADRAPEFLAPTRIEGPQLENWVHYEPLGTVLAVMPWNFPYVQVFRFAPAMLVAGNTVVLKHAGNVPQCALRIQEVIEEAGLPAGAFQTLLVNSATVDRILSDDRVQGVTLTGSEAAGSAVASIAGRELKTSVMELGGSDPFIVLADADIERAAARGCTSRYSNSGQACINAKRFIVLESVADAFESALVEEAARLRVGDPLDPDTEVGPLARREFVDALREQVEDSVAAGATLRTGGFPGGTSGAFVDPVVLTEVTPEMRVFREETFGPVAAVIRVPDESAAVRLANDSAYGLGASIWTADHEHGKRLAAEIQAGMVFVNEVVVSDRRLPFGGIKRSGYGRELGVWGMREFTEIKSVAVAAQPVASAEARPADALAVE